MHRNCIRLIRRIGCENTLAAVADRLSVRRKKAADCFLSIIKLGKSRLCRHEVLEIIENRCVSAKFGIDGEDLARIKKWLSDARVSGEMDEKQKNKPWLFRFQGEHLGPCN